MKRKLYWVLGVGLAGGISFIPHALAGDSTPKWSAKMQDLYKTLSGLMTDVSSATRFRDRSNFKSIEKQTEKLSKLTHDLNGKGMSVPNLDPTLKIISGIMGRETKRAFLELKKGNREYARALLRTIPSYCIACHTRSSAGPQFSKLELEPSSKSLSAVERGQFFAATRQFDRALNEYKKVIQNPKTAEMNGWEWEIAVNQSLAIAVRVNRDPVKAQEIVQTVLSTPNAPIFMKQDARIWKTSVEEWQTERARSPQTREGLHSEAMRLFGKAHELQRFPMDRTADILYLRASSLVHDLLDLTPQGPESAEALLLAGISYEVLTPLQVESLSEIYYEACIRSAPHSGTAELCNRRLESSVYAGYTGSAGTHVPKDMRDRLKELRELSTPSPEVAK